MSALTEFLDDVLPDVPGCSVAMALRAIRDAAVELCRESLCYRHEPDPISIVAATRDYALTIPANTRVSSVIYAEAAEKEIFAAGDDVLDAEYLTRGIRWRQLATTGDVEYFQMTDAGRGTIRLILTPASSVADGLVLRLALEPTPTATVVPDWLLAQYRDAVAHGAKKLLMAMQKKPWSDADRAKYHSQEFELCKGRTDTSTAKGFARAPLRVRSHYR